MSAKNPFPPSKNYNTSRQRGEMGESCDRKRAPVRVSHRSVTVETANRDVKFPSPWEQKEMERMRMEKCMEWAED